MKKFVSKLALILAVALTLCTAAFLGACDGNNTTKTATEFSVTVIYADGSPVDGTKDGGDNYEGIIKIQFCDASGESCATPIPLGADGKVTKSISELKEALGGVENFSLHVLGLKDGYTYDENIVLNAQNASVTIKLSK